MKTARGEGLESPRAVSLWVPRLACKPCELDGHSSRRHNRDTMIRRKTCKRYNDAWHAHALTFSCFQRRPLLELPAACELFVSSLDAARDRHCFDIWAYVVMPEHVHLLICPRQGEYSISAILLGIKRPASFHIRRATSGQLPHFWMPGGGYDRNLRTSKAIHSEMDYIHHNPVRRGLCERPGDWPFSSARYWISGDAVPLAMDHTAPLRED